MTIAITGATGFVGSHLARKLVAQGHHVVLIARGIDRRDMTVRELRHATFIASGLDDEAQLADAFAGCEAVAHLAGINRNLGAQTFERVHVEGTQHVVNAARRARVTRIALLSFLRARPDCGSAYHESKWLAEQIVRASGLDYTIVKAGVIYGTGDHMLDHLSHALHTFPVFGLVGLRDKPVRPLAIADLTRLLIAGLIEGRLSKQTIAVTGPDEMMLGQAVRRVGEVVGRHPFYVRLPLWFHYAFACCLERTMTIPMVSMAQVRILSEGIVEPYGGDVGSGDGRPTPLPSDLVPRTPFSDEHIRAGLPEPGRFGLSDCRCCAWLAR